MRISIRKHYFQPQFYSKGDNAYVGSISKKRNLYTRSLYLKSVVTGYIYNYIQRAPLMAVYVASALQEYFLKTPTQEHESADLKNGSSLPPKPILRRVAPRRSIRILYTLATTLFTPAIITPRRGRRHHRPALLPTPLQLHELNLILLARTALDPRLHRLRNRASASKTRFRVFRARGLAARELVRRVGRVVVVVVFGVGLCGAEAAREDVCEEAAQGGHADAEDADEGFEHGPVCCGDIVECGVCRGGELN